MFSFQSRWARVYRALLKAAWLYAFEYRAQVALWLLAMVFPLVMMAVWLALVNEAGSIQGWEQADFMSYYIAVVIVRHITSAWVLWGWDNNIRLGELSTKLLKPLNPFHEITAMQTLGWKCLIVAILFPVVIGLAIASPLINYTTDVFMLSLGAISLVLGFLLDLFFTTSFAMLGFWTTQSKNIYSLVFGIGQFLSGFIAPLTLYPADFRYIAYLSPFRSTLGLPVEILMGRLAIPEIMEGLAVTIVWILVFSMSYRILWRRGLRRYEAVGA
jgi:ABC-2 type transport system permease protein